MKPILFCPLGNGSIDIYAVILIFVSAKEVHQACGGEKKTLESLTKTKKRGTHVSGADLDTSGPPRLINHGRCGPCFDCWVARLSQA